MLCLLFSLFTPRLFIQKFINIAELFLRGCNLLKWTYVEGDGTCKTNRDEQGGGVSKTGNFEQTYFLNVPLPFLIFNLGGVSVINKLSIYDKGRTADESENYFLVSSLFQILISDIYFWYQEKKFSFGG